nr:MAG TPA: hypothetical protein [Caudoviricetes sp.]
MAGKGCGYKPPTAALRKMLVGRICVSSRAFGLG